MPKVGDKHFAYTEAGKKAAKKYAAETGRSGFKMKGFPAHAGVSPMKETAQGSSPVKWDPFGIKRRRKEKAFYEKVSASEKEQQKKDTGTITDADKATAWKNLKKDRGGRVDKNTEESQKEINKRAQETANARKKESQPKPITVSPAKHKPKESGAWEAKFGDKPEKDTHKHPHTEEVQATADYYKKGDARYKDAKGYTERALEKGPRKDLPVRLDMHTKSEVRALRGAEANPEYYKPTAKKDIKNPKYKKK